MVGAGREVVKGSVWHACGISIYRDNKYKAQKRKVKGQAAR